MFMCACACACVCVRVRARARADGEEGGILFVGVGVCVRAGGGGVLVQGAKPYNMPRVVSIRILQRERKRGQDRDKSARACVRAYVPSEMRVLSRARGCSSLVLC